MNDSDNPNNADPKSDLANASHAKPNTASRTSDIYERFLSRVQKIDSDIIDSDIDDDDDLHETALYEPISEEELRLFADFKQDYDTNNEALSIAVNSEHADDEDISDDNTLNKSDSDHISNQISDSIKADVGVAELADSRGNNDEEDRDKGTTVTTTNALNDVDTIINNPPASKISKAKKIGVVRGRQVSSVKLLIIGVVCGLLLSTIIVIVLNRTGVLSALTDSLAANSPEPVSTSAPAVPVAQPKIVETSNLEEQSITTDTVIEPKPNKEIEVAAQTTENAVTNNKNTLPTKQATAATIAESKSLATKPSTAQLNSNATADLDITYEDFREEAQNTLYRETND